MPHGSFLPSSPPPFYQGGSGDLICIWEKGGGGERGKTDFSFLSPPLSVEPNVNALHSKYMWDFLSPFLPPHSLFVPFGIIEEGKKERG